ncbi:uncharacterized protein VTP21DRAFT_549 [Calcarisporiella thermophila]|uniref:uncharacterized protein n=1 Tax=Calcarisporiella thermophila TaxID=911321 RepID=UPI0037439CD5
MSTQMPPPANKLRLPVHAASEYTESEMDPAEQTWDDWVEDEGESQPQCLFCPQTFPNSTELIIHCKDTHNFDFLYTKYSNRLDFYQSMRLINYIRTQVKNGATLDGFKVEGSESFLNDDTYLAPVLDNDTFLYTFEEAEEDLSETVTVWKRPQDPECTTELEHELINRLRLAEEQLHAVDQQFSEYRNMVKKTFMPDDLRSERSFISTRSNLAAQTGFTDEGNYYFNSYANAEIHKQMIKDRVRTDAYRDFIYHNKDIFKDKIVLDVGCGTGILSMFAAKAGAARVISVDNSNIIEKTQQIVRDNGLDNVITLIRGKIEEVALPVPQVDIIISEWMGYFLLFEAMLDSVLVARDRWLAPGGILAPSQTRILLMGIEDEEFINDSLFFWNDVYGFNMNCMKDITEAIVDDITEKSQITTVACLKDIPHQNIRASELDFETEFTIVAKRPGTLHAFVGYFDTWFTRDGRTLPVDLENEKQGMKDGEIFFTTGPHGISTHWKQTAFILEKPVSLEKDTQVSGTFRCWKAVDNPRELDIEVRYRVGEGEEVSQCFYLK